MIKANDTPVWRNENIGTPTLAPVKTAAAHARRDSVAALAPSVLQAVPPRAAAYSSVNPGRVPVGAVVDVSHIRRSECLLQSE